MRIETGMKRKEAVRLLGAPNNKSTGRGFLSSYESVSGSSGLLGLLLRQEFWMYTNHPTKGMTTMITFTKGRVSDVLSQRTGDE